MSRYRIRGVLPEDHDDLVRVAHHLNSVNLPENDEAVRGIIDISTRSFSGQVKDPRRAEFVFVLEDLQEKRVIGTSMIIGQLGRRDAPYIYFDVRSEEKYSSTLDKHFHHTVLRIGYSYDGPTEIGGIVLMPSYRREPEKLGLFLSYVRFLFIAMHRDKFRDEILAELLPPLESDGTSHLWEALGRRFTGMSYMEADKLSKRNKEFIKGLFPEGDVYASVLSAEAQRVVGEVGPQTKGVEMLLERIGFRYAERIDPFDGGPHFTAATDEITLVQASRRLPIVGLLGDVVEDSARREKAIVATECAEAPFWRSVIVACEERDGGVLICAEDAATLDAKVGDVAMVLPIRPHRQPRSSRSASGPKSVQRVG